MYQAFEASQPSDVTQASRKFIRNPSPDNGDQKALIVVQDLSLGSLFPLLKLFFNHGPLLVYYKNASPGGLRLGSILFFFSITVSTPLKINDMYFVDTSHVTLWKPMYEVLMACQDQLDQIEGLIIKHLPKCTEYIRKLMVTNVCKTLQLWLYETHLLRKTAKQLGKQEGVSADAIFLITRYASMMKILNLATSPDDGICILPQINQNKVLQYTLTATGLSFLKSFRNLFKLKSFREETTPSNSIPSNKIGIAAAWGLDEENKNLFDDFFWWRESSIQGNRLVYMFERKDFQPTRKVIEQVEKLGIESVVLKSKFVGDYPNLLIKNIWIPPFFKSLEEFFLQLKLAKKTLFADRFTQTVLALVNWQYYVGKNLANIYKTLNIKGIFHFDEAGMDIISLASAMNDSLRIGTNWSSHTCMNLTSSRSPQVYFLWGNHDAQVALGAKSTSKVLLISGSFIFRDRSTQASQNSKKKVEEMREIGVRYVLTLLDNSPPCPEFYRFFFQWLIEDPYLGLLIKSKGRNWPNLSKDGLDGLVERAKKTNRVHVVDSKASPADAAMLSDFTVGIASTSALIVAALHGARIIFLDYERFDQGPLKTYCILHSLGPGRCVFYKPEKLRQAVIKYIENPSENSDLGDATPILDQLDPFRDGKASKRIGEFVGWYLEGLDGGSIPDEAVRSATERYAQKWGADKVIRGL